MSPSVIFWARLVIHVTRQALFGTRRKRETRSQISRPEGRLSRPTRHRRALMFLVQRRQQIWIVVADFYLSNVAVKFKSTARFNWPTSRRLTDNLPCCLRFRFRFCVLGISA